MPVTHNYTFYQISKTYTLSFGRPNYLAVFDFDIGGTTYKYKRTVKSVMDIFTKIGGLFNYLYVL